MKQELVDKLIELYPLAYRRLKCIEIGDGWYNILNILSKNIEHHLKGYKIPEEPPSEICFTQIKEKFGTLRTYTNFCDDYVDGAIDMAEDLSAITCEDCGKEASLAIVNNYWLRTLCDKCCDIQSAKRYKIKEIY